MIACRFTTHDASIFSVAEGAKLAQTPPKQITHFEQLRANRIAKAALETPLLNGMRLLPEYTPGRALLWGSVIALWGSGAIFMTAAKGLNIHAVRPLHPAVLGTLLLSIIETLHLDDGWPASLTRCLGAG